MNFVRLSQLCARDIVFLDEAAQNPRDFSRVFPQCATIGIAIGALNP
jgi:hypothetical protein